MNQTLATLFTAAIALSAVAAPQSFDFKDPKGVNNVVFKLDAPLEAINGSASGISGMVEFDAANPGNTRGKIVVAADSLQVPNSTMKEHMHGGQWLDVANHKEIIFEARELKDVKTAGEKTTANAIGTLTIKGIAKEVTVPVTITHLKDKLGARLNKPELKGDLLVIRATFTIKRTDYGINPGAPIEKVSNEIELTLSIAGASPQK